MSACSNSSDFIIPKGKAFEFTVQIMEESSFLPQVLDAFSSGTFTLIDIVSGNAVGSPIALNKLDAGGFYSDNGYLKGNISSGVTSGLTVKRGDAVDGYYPKPSYQGIVQVNFSDATPDRTGVLCEVYVINAG